MKKTINNSFKDIANNYISETLDDWDNFRPLDTYLQKITDTESDIAHEFRECCEALFGWIGLNNSKKSNSEAILATYVTSDATGTLPSQEEFKRMYAAVSGKGTSLTYIKGHRGAGKSAALNYFFTLYGKKLQDDGFTYFRCDARKLQDIDNFIEARHTALKSESKSPIPANTEATQKGITLEEYIEAHNIYVALMHSRDDKWLESFAVSHTPLEEGRYGKFSGFLERRSCTEELELWKEIVKQFLSQSELNPEKSGWLKAPEMARFIADIVVLHFRTSKHTGNLISNFHSCIALQNGYKGTILTIDGTDNFSRIEPETRCYYDNLLKQLRSFNPIDKSTRRYKSVILAMRPETLQEFTMENASGPKATTTTTFTVKAASVSEIMKRKHTAAIGLSALDHYANVRERTNAIFIDFLGNFESFLRIYIFILSDLVRTHLKKRKSLHQLGDEALLLEILFQNNIRSMQRNIIGSYLHCYRVFEVERPFTQYKSLTEWARIKKWPIKEGSILVGEVSVLDDSVTTSPLRRGRWCPPLFSYQRDETDCDYWYGLGLYRVLQLVRYRRSTSEKRAVEWLGVLGYPQETVLWQFNRALMYGLLKVDDEQAAQRITSFTLTNKGEFILDSMFENFGLLYYQAASNSFPTYFHGTENSLHIHDQFKYIDRGYFQAAISVCLAILKCVVQSHTIEMANANNKSSNASKLSKCFSKPNYRKTIRALSFLFFRLQERKTGTSDAEEFYRSGLLMQIAEKIN